MSNHNWQTGAASLWLAAVSLFLTGCGSDIGDPAKLKAMKAYLRRCFGQKLANSLDYDVLQPPLLDYVRDQAADLH